VTEAPPLRWPDALRFAFGTLTVLPVEVSRWDRPAARGGMAVAPLVGAVVGLLAAACGALLVALGANPLLAAVATVAAPAALTRGLHLDGLADTADGLGSGQPAGRALEIMKRSDIGPFGVVTLLFVLLTQVAALSACYGHGWLYGAAAAVASGVMGRAVMTLACREGVPAAREGGLGAAVASSLSPRTAWSIVALCAALCLALGAPFHGFTGLRFLAGAAASVLCAELLLRRCRVRFSGVTGDVFGALCEAGSATALVVFSLR
jgi:adenosylcobinamide-GDP ribazoletransferase